MPLSRSVTRLSYVVANVPPHHGLSGSERTRGRVVVSGSCLNVPSRRYFVVDLPDLEEAR